MELLRIQKEHNLQLKYMAKEIGIAEFTLQRFILSGSARESTEKKIEKFIEKYQAL